MDREEIQGDIDALRAVVSRFQEHSYEALTNPERLGLLEVLECQTRRLQVPAHQLINQVAEQGDSAELGGKLSWALADRLHITRGEASRRIADAADLGPRLGRFPVSRWRPCCPPPRRPSATGPSVPTTWR